MKKIIKLIKSTALVIAIGFIIWACGFAWFASKASGWKPHDINQATDAIIVLTGGEGRIKAGLNLLSAKRSSHLFITSVHNLLDEQNVRNRWSGQSTLPDCCIVLDHTADSTAQNALAARQWISEYNAKINTANDDVAANPINNIRLVTSNYHMPRAILDFQRLLPAITIYAPSVIEFIALRGFDLSIAITPLLSKKSPQNGTKNNSRFRMTAASLNNW